MEESKQQGAKLLESAKLQTEDFAGTFSGKAEEALEAAKVCWGESPSRIREQGTPESALFMFLGSRCSRCDGCLARFSRTAMTQLSASCPPLDPQSPSIRPAEQVGGH